MNQINQNQGVGDRVNTAALETIQKGGSVQQVGTQYSTAIQVQIPRDLTEVERRCLVEANLAGDTVYYGFPAGDGFIEGPSIECAMILLRNYGNAALAQRPVVETDRAFIFSSAFVDLETGVTYERQYRQSKKSKVHFKTDDARKDEIRFAIGQSKSDRNVVTRVLPRWLSDKMIEIAKEGVRAKIEKWIKAKGLVFAQNSLSLNLGKYGVDDERIELKYKKSKNQWQAHELTLMSGDLKALQNGYETAEAIFPIKTIERTEDVNLTGQSMTIGDPTDHTDHEGDKDENPDRAPSGSDSQTGIEPIKATRKEVIAQIKYLEANKFMTDRERTAVKDRFAIANLSRTSLEKLVDYRDKLAQMIKAAESQDTPPAPEPEAEPPAEEIDLDPIIEEIIALEESTGQSSEAIAKFGDELKMSDDLSECSAEQLTAYRDFLRLDLVKKAADAPEVNLEKIAELERSYAVHITASDLGDLRDKHLGGPEPDMATQAELDGYAAILTTAVEKAKAEKESEATE